MPNYHEIDPTRQLHQFEAVGLNPAVHNDAKLLAAFRAGNIVIASTLLTGGKFESIRYTDDLTESIGKELAYRATHRTV
ncbi:MAG: hypothetical protein NVS1B7_4490 [Candidatus Saccharimonadales bacterium]